MTKYRDQVDAKKDPDKKKQALINIAEMLKAAVERGNVTSCVLMFVEHGNGPTAALQNRFIVRRSELDLIDDIYSATMGQLVGEYGITPAQVRQDRAQAQSRRDREKDGNFN